MFSPKKASCAGITQLWSVGNTNVLRALVMGQSKSMCNKRGTAVNNLCSLFKWAYAEAFIPVSVILTSALLLTVLTKPKSCSLSFFSACKVVWNCVMAGAQGRIEGCLKVGWPSRYCNRLPDKKKKTKDEKKEASVWEGRRGHCTAKKPGKY